MFIVVKRECRRLARLMFKYEPLPDEMAEELLLHRPNDELRIDLVNALESLPANYLEVVLLRDFEELTIAEIAATLDEQPGAVKSRQIGRASCRERVCQYV